LFTSGYVSNMTAISANMVQIAGGMVAFPDQMPEVFADSVLAFLARKYPAR